MSSTENTISSVNFPSLEPCQHHKRHKNWAVSKYAVLVAAAILVFAFCGILLSLRRIFTDSKKNVSGKRNDFTSEKKPVFDRQYQCSAVCASTDCIKTAARMLLLMDPEVDPCDDFYSYACGGYDKVVMGNRKKEYIINDAAEDILKVVKDMMEKLPESVPQNTPGSSITKIRKFYESCMNLRSSEEMAIPTAIKYLEYFGIKNWPHLDSNYSFTDPDVDESLVRLALYHTFLFFTLQNFEDDDEGNIQPSNAPEAGAPEFKVKVPIIYNQIFHVDGYVSEETMKIMKATLDYFEVPDIVSKEIIEDILSFDLGISNITRDTIQRREQCETNDTVSCSSYYYYCTEKRSSNTDRWCKNVEKLLRDSDFLKIHPKIRIILEDRQHFQDLGEYLDRISHRTIAHALALRFFADNAIAMNYLLRRKASYRNPFSWLIEEMPEIPSMFCAKWISRRLPILVATAFYSNIYKNEVHEEVNEIFSDVRQSLISIVQDTPWIDKEAKVSASELLSNITLSGDAYLQYIRNVSATDEFSKELHITEESFLANDLESKKFLIINAIQVLDNATKMEDLSKFPFELDPTYAGTGVNLEIGSFLFPVIAIGRSRYSNLGFFGGVVGHELSHALEVFLRGYENKSGKFEKAFEKRKKCLADHYSEYEIDLIGEKVNGNVTLNENLADFYGFRAIFKSLMKYQGKRGFLERLPGLPFDNEQILFVSYAQLWCETNTLDSLKHYMQDNHSPGKHRVWGIYKNFALFSEAFNCPLGSTMNPIRKCNLES